MEIDANLIIQKLMMEISNLKMENIVLQIQVEELIKHKETHEPNLEVTHGD